MPLEKITKELVLEISRSYPNLGELSLSDNLLTRIEHLEALGSSLTVLDVSRNRIESLDGISSLSLLSVLRVASNQIYDLPDEIRGLIRLREVDISDNALTDFRSLLPLQQLPSLTVLSLHGNPISRLDEYRERVLSMFPLLLELDGKPITEGERLFLRLQQSESERPQDGTSLRHSRRGPNPESVDRSYIDMNLDVSRNDESTLGTKGGTLATLLRESEIRTKYLETQLTDRIQKISDLDREVSLERSLHERTQEELRQTRSEYKKLEVMHSVAREEIDSLRNSLTRDGAKLLAESEQEKANLRIEFSEKETSFRQRIAELERELETTRETGRHLRAYFAGPEFDARIRSDSRVLNESGNAFDIGFHDPESRSSLTGSSIEKFAPLPFQADDVESSHSQTDNHSSRSNTLPSTRELELASSLRQREALMNEYRQELDLLRTQLSALQHIVQVQEKQIRKASVPTASNFPSQSASSSTSTPALALLTRWREKVYSTLVQLKSEELQREELRREFSHQMTQMEEELHAAVEEKDLFRQKSIQLEARAELAEEHAKGFRSKVSALELREQRLLKDANGSRKGLRDLKLVLSRVVEEVQKYDDLCRTVASRFKTFNRRVEFAESRIRTIRTLLSSQSQPSLENHLVDSAVVSDVEDELNRLRTERDALAARVRRQELIEEQTRKALQLELAGEKDSLRRQILETTEQLDEKERDLLNAQRESDSLRIQLRDRDSALTKLQSDLESFRVKSLESEESHSREIQLSVRKETEHLQKTIRSLEEESDELRVSLAKITARAEQLEREVVREKTREQQRERGTREFYEEEMEARRKENSDLRRERNALLATVRDLERENESIRRRLRQAETSSAQPRSALHTKIASPDVRTKNSRGFGEIKHADVRSNPTQDELIQRKSLSERPFIREVVETEHEQHTPQLDHSLTSSEADQQVEDVTNAMKDRIDRLVAFSSSLGLDAIDSDSLNFS